MEKGDAKDAIAALRLAVAANPDDPIAWDFLGQAYLQTDDRENAISSFKLAIPLRPAYIPTRVSLTSILFYESDWPAAEAAARETLAVDPRNAYSHYIIGTIDLRRQQPLTALDEANAALIIDAKYGDALLLKSQALVDLDWKRSTQPDKSAAADVKQHLRDAIDALETYAKLGQNEASSERLSFLSSRFYVDRGPPRGFIAGHGIE